MQGLLNSPLLETIICLVLVYALLSLLVSSFTELLNSYFQNRGRMLYQTISSMFADGINVNFGQLLYGHPAIQKMRRNIDRLPQYISNEMFATSLLDVVADHSREFKFNDDVKAITMVQDERSQFERFKTTVMNMQHTPLKLQLMNMVERCAAPAEGQPDNRLDELTQQITQWYANQMERTSGWYKASIQWRLLWMGLLVALLLNVDSIFLFQSLYRSPVLRQQLLPVAEAAAEQYAKLKTDSSLTDLQRAYRTADSLKPIIKGKPNDTVTVALDKILVQLSKIDSINHKADSLREQLIDKVQENADLVASLSLPIGWRKESPPFSWFRKIEHPKGYFEKHQKASFWNVISYLLGIAITALSLQFGAPFWFDVLMKLVNLRRAGTKPKDDK